MYRNNGEYNSSFLKINGEPQPINLVKVSPEVMIQFYPDITEEEMEKLQNDLIIICQILLKNQ
jgi:hypothetical protein